MFARAVGKLMAYYPAGASGTRVEVILKDGEHVRNYDKGRPDITVRINSYRVLARYLVFGVDGFIEGYINGEVDLEGEMPIRKLNQLKGVNAKRGWSFAPLLWLRALFVNIRNSNRTLTKARHNAIFHYDHPRRFYELVNGMTMGYTECYLRSEDDDLDTAQRQKFEHIARKLYLKPGQKVVEVGTGCGYLACHMAKDYDVDVTNYGLVPKQNETLAEVIKEWGVEERVRNVVKDHRELLDEPEKYDRYVSVGIYEHAGKKFQEDWIRSISTCLKHGGVGFISCLGFMRPMTDSFFIGKYIFPGTKVPSLAEVLVLMEKHDLHVVDIENLWYHYARALEEWAKNFNKHWSEIQKLDPERYDERFRRIWQTYLEGLSAIFGEGEWGVDLFHITFTKGKNKDFYPLTRDFIYEK